MNQNIFYEDWRECLRAHYAHVIQQADTNNETSLITVLQWTGFSSDEITAMRRETLQLLGLADDSVLEIAEGESVSAAEADSPEAVIEEPVVAEAVENPESAAAEVAIDAIEPEAEIEAQAEIEEPAASEPDEDEPPAPRVQMTLF